MSEHLPEERLLVLASGAQEPLSLEEDSHIENCPVCIRVFVQLVKKLTVN
jgi:hypothetical protein